MTADNGLGGNVGVDCDDQDDPNESGGQALVLCQLDGKEGNDGSDHNGLNYGGSQRLDLIALLQSVGSSGKGECEISNDGNAAHNQSQNVQPLSAKDIGNIAVCTAAEQPDEGFIGNSQGFALQDHVGQAAEHQHAGQSGDKGRNMDESNPEGLPCADGKTNGQHSQNGNAHGGSLAHENGADGTDEADNGTNGQVDVTAGQDAQQHTGCQHEHIGVLREKVGDVLGQKQLTAGLNAEESSHQHQNQDHGVFLDKVQCFFLIHMPFLLYLLLLRMAPMIFSWVASLPSNSPTMRPSLST